MERLLERNSYSFFSFLTPTWWRLWRTEVDTWRATLKVCISAFNLRSCLFSLIIPALISWCSRTEFFKSWRDWRESMLPIPLFLLVLLISVESETELQGSWDCIWILVNLNGLDQNSSVYCSLIYIYIYILCTNQPGRQLTRSSYGQIRLQGRGGRGEWLVGGQRGGRHGQRAHRGGGGQVAAFALGELAALRQVQGSAEERHPQAEAAGEDFQVFYAKAGHVAAVSSSGATANVA